MQTEIEEQQKLLAKDVQVFLESINEGKPEIIQGIIKLREFYEYLLKTYPENLSVYATVLAPLTTQHASLKDTSNLGEFNNSMRSTLKLMVAILVQAESFLKEEDGAALAHFLIKELLFKQKHFMHGYIQMQVMALYLFELQTGSKLTLSQVSDKWNKKVSANLREKIESRLANKIASSISFLCAAKEQARVAKCLEPFRLAHHSETIQASSLNYASRLSLKDYSENSVMSDGSLSIADKFDAKGGSYWGVKIDWLTEKLTYCQNLKAQEELKLDKKNIIILQILDKELEEIELVLQTIYFFEATNTLLHENDTYIEVTFLWLCMVYNLLVKLDHYEEDRKRIEAPSKNKQNNTRSSKRNRNWSKTKVIVSSDSKAEEDQNILGSRFIEINAAENEKIEMVEQLNNIILEVPVEKKIEIQFDLKEKSDFSEERDDKIKLFNEIEIKKVNSIFSNSTISILEKIEALDKKLTYAEVVRFFYALMGQEKKGNGSRRKLILEGNTVCLHEGHGKDRGHYCTVSTLKQLKAMLDKLGVSANALRNNEWVPSCLTLQDKVEEEEKAEKKSRMGKK